MKIIKNALEILSVHKKDSKLIIYGGGVYGADLRCELNLMGFHGCYNVCDSNIKIREYIDNFISVEELFSLLEQEVVSIIIAVKNEKAVKEIAENIITRFGKSFNAEEIDLYQYVPESREELIERRKKEGVFDGIIYRKALNDNDAIQILKDMITGPKAFLFARWGTIEGDVVYRMKAGVNPTSTEYTLLKQNAGVFPITGKVIESYCNIMENAALEIDMLCIFYWQMHLDKWIEWFSPKAILVSSALEYPFFSNPWTEALRGMKVLVIHPYSKLIDEQYKKRDRLFVNPDVLLEFDLVTYQAVQSMGGNDAYDNWIEALKSMQSDISKIDFDIALIGCGAYGMPLGAFIKSTLHKKAIHMGGSLQILFGIKGKRWESESYDYQHKLYNKYWVRPTDDLKPKNYKNVEDGCYW